MHLYLELGAKRQLGVGSSSTYSFTGLDLKNAIDMFIRTYPWRFLTSNLSGMGVGRIRRLLADEELLEFAEGGGEK